MNKDYIKNVILFLEENEQYGDDWSEEIKALKAVSAYGGPLSKIECREQIQEDISTFLDGMDDGIIGHLCDIVVENFAKL